MDVKKVLSKCSKCKESKYPTVPTIPPMGEQKSATRPFQMIALDYLSGFVRSKSGNTDLLVCLDIFSKYVRLFPVKKISVDSLTKIIESEWFFKLGVPQTLISDNAVTFLGNKFQELLKKYNVHHFKNARRHCQNNPVERVNRVILACIRTYCQSDHRLWDTQIAQIEFAINNTKHLSTGYTPFFLVHGYESIVDGRDHLQDRQTSDPSIDQFTQRREVVVGPLYEEVVRNNKKQFEKYKKNYDSRHKALPPTFSIGQKVYKKHFKLSNAADHYAAKLGPVYVPCKIIARRGATSYELEDENGRNLGVFAAQDLIPE